MKKKYKTKFPVARIKKIMQLDEDVGKVAQATPILISKALELFMQSLIDQSCQESRSRSAKRLTVAHLKKTIETVEQFDFLKGIVASIPDPLEPSEESTTQKSRSARKAVKANKEEQ
ncbi:DR1-associated protein 1 [Sporodiniella umbellata]|nr:DR1-associated protein 1 [Sporodiniella umbellata]